MTTNHKEDMTDIIGNKDTLIPGVSAEITGDAVSLETPWEGLSGEQVEALIKRELARRVGYFPPQRIKGDDGNYHLYGFASEQAYSEWNTDPEANAHLLLADAVLPEGGGQQAASYMVGLYTDAPSVMVTTGDSLELRVRFTSEEFNPVTQTSTDTTEGGTLTVQSRVDSQSPWRDRGTFGNIPSMPSASGSWHSVDIGPMLPRGAQQVRIIVRGETTGLNTRYIQFSVTKTSLTLQFRNQWQVPVTGSSLPLLYTYTGDVSKTLNLRISGQGGTRTVRFPLGTRTYTETPNQFDVTDSDADAVKVMSHGVHEIEAWLSVDGMDGTQSEHVFSQVMVLADGDDTTPHIMLNNIRRELTNWSSATLFDWAVYNPSGLPLPVRFSLRSPDGSETYLSLTEENPQPGVVYTFGNMLEIDSGIEAFSVEMHFTSGEAVLREPVSFEVDNTQNFAPVSGADFILNPRLRSNTESDPATVINAADGSVIPAEFRGFGFVSDGWVTDSKGVRCLRVPAGRELIIHYEALEDYKGGTNVNKTGSLTFEIDYAVRAVTDERTPVLRMCSYSGSGNPLGWEMRPLEACFMTQGKVARKNQDIGYQEGERTRVAVNLLYNLSGSGQNYCRMFVNGVINRELNYADNDVFVQYVDGVETSQGIRIGGTQGADIDIYSIKVYKKALTSTDVLQNYKASLDDTYEKLAFAAANDIMSNGLLDWDKAFEKYNVIKWIGRYPTYGDAKKDTFLGTLVIHQQGLPRHSGVITNVRMNGQGTSAMTYDWWNGQAKYGEDSVWTDEEGTVRGRGFQLAPDMPVSLKDVGKVNFASSMQSHKIGATALYNDLWKAVCGGSSITRTPGYENCRAAVLQKPFLFFVQDDEVSEPRFASFMTFGPGKGDRPTFGFDSERFPDFICIEGADNDRDLVMGRVPWIDGDVTVDGEDILYNGQKQFSLVGGDISKIAPFKSAWNFVFTHFDDIDFHRGTLDDLQSDVSADTSKHYWVTEAGEHNAQYDLYRYDFINSKWVDAGTGKTATGYSKVNINTQCGNIAGGSNWEEQNRAFKEARLSLFKQGVGRHFDQTQALFTMNFCKFMGASDNRGKNTYVYYDPETGLIGWFQDDLDSIFLTDNVGQASKPYDVEEHDKDDAGNPYWNSESNSFFNQMELAFPDEQRANMRAILQEMARLSDDNTVLGCFERYFFSVQRYFPAVAYNEVARLVYERARTRYVQGIYQNGTDPITQSCGDSLQREMQWVKRRIAYISSYASYGEFGRRDGEGAAGSLNFRSIVRRDGSRPAYSFTLVPHISMYPTFALGSTLVYGAGNVRAPRVRAGETYKVNLGSSDGNTNIFLNGIDHMRDIGDFTDKSLGETFNLTGARLTEFVVSGGSDVQFRPASMVVSAPLLQRLVLNGVDTLEGNLDLSANTQLREIDLRGTSLSSVTLPATEHLETLHLPATLTSLVLDAQPNLKTLTLESVTNLRELRITGAPGLRGQTQPLIQLAYVQAKNLSLVQVGDIDWSGFPVEAMMWLHGMGATLTGSISLTGTLTLGDKIALAGQYGDIDDAGNALHLSYATRAINSIAVSGPPYTPEIGTYGYTLTCAPSTGNDIAIRDGSPAIEWSIDGSAVPYASFSDTVNGLLEVSALDGSGSDMRHIIRCSITKTNGTVLTREYPVGFYRRVPKIGDFAYADGTFDDLCYSNKTVVGIVFKLDEMWQGDGEAEPTVFTGYEKPSEFFKSTRQLVGYRVLIDCKENILFRSSDGFINLDNVSWGLYPDNGGLGHGEIQNEMLAATGLSNVFDIDMVANVADHCMTGEDDGRYLLATNYYDVGTDDGFHDYSTVSGGVTDWRGEQKTLAIIHHANRIINTYLHSDSNESVGICYTDDGGTEHWFAGAPATVTELADAMEILHRANNNINKYQQFLYPAAYSCYLYEPKVNVNDGETLDPQYAATNWYLPAVGELARIYSFHARSRTGGIGATSNVGRGTSPNKSVIDGMIQAALETDEPNDIKANVSPTHAESGDYTYTEQMAINRYFHSLVDAEKPIYSMALWRIQVGDNPFTFASHKLSGHWTSTEANHQNSWFVNFTDGYVNNWGGHEYGNKWNSRVSRPIVAYQFFL